MPSLVTYDLLNGHVVADIAGSRCLIDTGAPASFGRIPDLVIAGHGHRIADSYLGTSAGSLSTNVGGRVDALVGTDILNEHDVLIDPAVSTILFSREPLPLVGTMLPLRTVVGIPAVTAVVAGREAGLVFDTGAKLSYLDPELTRHLAVAGTGQDYFPWFGGFSTPVFDADLDLAGERITVRVGNLPTLLAMSLLIAGTSGVLGSALLATHRVAYAPRRGVLGLERFGEARQGAAG